MIVVSPIGTAAMAQKVKSNSKDTTQAYRANDRLKNAGPTNGWPSQQGSKPLADSVRAKKDTVTRKANAQPARKND